MAFFELFKLINLIVVDVDQLDPRVLGKINLSVLKFLCCPKYDTIFLITKMYTHVREIRIVK